MDYAVIGYPIKHSYSPFIHNTNFKLNEDDFFYDKLEVTPESLSNIRNIMNEKDLQGINVTVPHKEMIIPYLDYVNGHGRTIKAVNTVKRVDDKLYGYNTDVSGYKKTIIDNHFKHENVLILGAGGAAKAVLLAHQELGSNVTIVARRKESFETFKNKEFIEVTIDQFDGGEFDIVINATPLGLNNEDPFKVFKLYLLSNLTNTVGYDLIYNPAVTPFMTYFNKSINGLDMLVNQAMLSYEIWTGKGGNKEAVKSTLKQFLEENHE